MTMCPIQQTAYRIFQSMAHGSEVTQDQVIMHPIFLTEQKDAEVDAWDGAVYIYSDGPEKPLFDVFLINEKGFDISPFDNQTFKETPSVELHQHSHRWLAYFDQHYDVNVKRQLLILYNHLVELGYSFKPVAWMDYIQHALDQKNAVNEVDMENVICFPILFFVHPNKEQAFFVNCFPIEHTITPPTPSSYSFKA